MLEPFATHPVMSRRITAISKADLKGEYKICRDNSYCKRIFSRIGKDIKRFFGYSVETLSDINSDETLRYISSPGAGAV